MSLGRIIQIIHFDFLCNIHFLELHHLFHCYSWTQYVCNGLHPPYALSCQPLTFLAPCVLQGSCTGLLSVPGAALGEKRIWNQDLTHRCWSAVCWDPGTRLSVICCFCKLTSASRFFCLYLSPLGSAHRPKVLNTLAGKLRTFESLLITATQAIQKKIRFISLMQPLNFLLFKFFSGIQIKHLFFWGDSRSHWTRYYIYGY